MATSLSFSKILKAINEARDQSHAAPRICVVGEPAELSRVVGVLSAGAADESGGVSASLDALSPADFPLEARLARRWGVAVFLAAGSAGVELAPAVAVARRAGPRVVALAEGAEPGWAAAAGVSSDELAHGLGQRPAGKPTLENRLVRAAGDAGGALALALPAVRRAYCERVILTNAAQNGAIGAAFIIPGTDMPAMTANQIRMVLKIAAAYGQEVGLDRALELLSVVGSGFVFRTLARQALDFVPGLGWALKGAVGFSATVALGQGAIAYFEAGAPLQVSRMQRINRQLERANSRLPGVLQRRLAGR
ncbi:MAG: DUF697 domain-containing protein [Thermoleophilia bacterium]